MRYVSNLIAPDLRPYFKLKDPPIQICGHDIPSDPDFEPDCGYFSDDEGAILYHVAKQVGGTWIDVGARFGWTAAHILEAGACVILVDPQLSMLERKQRLKENLEAFDDLNDRAWYRDHAFRDCFGSGRCRSEFPTYHETLRGVVIDGCHDDPEPLNDAITAHKELDGEGVILLHDFWGQPIQRAANWLMDMGYKCRIYATPNGVAVCWRDIDFQPPDHHPDPAINWKAHCKNFDLSKCV